MKKILISSGALQKKKLCSFEKVEKNGWSVDNFPKINYSCQII